MQTRNRNNFGTGQNFMMPMDGPSLLAKVKPNIQGELAKAKRRKNILFACIPLCMIMFMGGAVLSSVTARGFFWPIPVIGFIGFGLTGVLLSVAHMNIFKLQALMTLIYEITGLERTSIDNLSLSLTVGKSSVILIIRQLIATRNLDGYELIGEVGVAKTGTARASDFMPSMQSVSGQFFHTCGRCGAVIGEQGGAFCSYCGARL